MKVVEMLKEIEICCFSVQSAQVADKNGASRIELCGGFLEGGTTPSHGLISQVLDKVSISVYVMIRPRGGDFCYTEQEVEVIKSDISFIKELKPQGFVFGALDADGTVNSTLCKEVIEACKPFPVTFHRAFDVASDIDKALENVIELGFERILTSGAKANVTVGFDNLVSLHKKAAGRIKIMAGAGMNPSILKKLEAAGLNSFHGSAKEWVNSEMTYHNDDVSMASGTLPDEYGRFESTAEKVIALLK